MIRMEINWHAYNFTAQISAFTLIPINPSTHHKGI